MADMQAYSAIEEMVLGGMLTKNDCVDEISTIIGKQHFSIEVNAKVFEAITDLFGQGRRADFRTLADYVAADFPEGRGVTASQYLARLAAIAPSAAQTIDYAKELNERYSRFQLEEIGKTLSFEAANPTSSRRSGQIIEDVEQALYRLNRGEVSKGGFQPFSEATQKALTAAIAAHAAGGGLSGLPTGLGGLDAKMGGLQNSDLIIVAGRPGMGKTALATNIGFHLALQGKSVGFFSLEMSAEQLATRILSDSASIVSSRIRRGQLEAYELQRLKEAQRKLASISLHIDDAPAASVAQVRSRARRLKRECGLDLVIVDYLQLMTAGRQGNRVQELTEISMGLKAIAKELNVPVMALSQLSRQVESREDKRPLLSDLRESGSIEQDADVVMFVYRHEYYLRMVEPPEGDPRRIEWDGEISAAQDKAEIIIGKQRHGPTGTVEVGFDANYTRFYTREPELDTPLHGTPPSNVLVGRGGKSTH